MTSGSVFPHWLVFWEVLGEFSITESYPSPQAGLYIVCCGREYCPSATLADQVNLASKETEFPTQS